MTAGTEEVGFAETEELAPRVVKRRKNNFVVRRMTESGSDPVIFSDEDKGLARAYVESHHPRGVEVYLQHPDGYREHFSADHKFQGSENAGWMPLEDEDE